MDEQQQPTVAPPTNSPAEGQDPGRTLAIVGLVCAFIFALVGLILCLIARSKSQKAGYNNTIATVGIVVAALNLVAGVALGVTGVI